MASNKTLKIIKWVIYAAILFLLYVLQVTPGLFEVYSARPVYIFPFAMFVAVFEGETGGSVMAVICGLLWDVSSSKLLGFSSVIMLVCSVAIALLVIYYVRATIINCVIMSAAAMLIYILLDFAFYYLIWEAGGKLSILIHNLLPMWIYTVVISPLIFIIVKAVASRFNDILRV